MAIKTVVDKNGDVWTGKAVDSGSAGAEIAANLLFFGLPALAGAADKPSATVEVNGERHSGTVVKK